MEHTLFRVAFIMLSCSTVLAERNSIGPEDMNIADIRSDATVAGTASHHDVKLSTFGRIVEEASLESLTPKYAVEDNEYYVVYNKMKFIGNGLYAVRDGYVTITEYEESVPAVLRIYNSAGELHFMERFARIINIRCSPNGTFIIFCTGTENVVLNTATYEKARNPASGMYAVDDEGYPVYYNDSDHSVIYRNIVTRFEDQVGDIVIYNNDPIVFTRRTIHSLEGNTSVELYDFIGSFFEARVVDERLYVVEREKQERGWLFTLFELTSGRRMNQVDRLIYTPRAVRSHEEIPAPLKYDSASYPFPIGNSYGEIQQYSGDPYLHPGVDFLGSDSEFVYAVKPGFVKAILTTSGAYHWRIAIAVTNTSDSTEGYLYAHLIQASIPFTVGDPVSPGEVVGRLVPWMVPGFTHCHFARIKAAGAVWNGAWWTTDNPLGDVANMVDTTAPFFEHAKGDDLFAFRLTDGTYLDPLRLRGGIRIIASAYDYANSPWRIDVSELSFRLFSSVNPDIPLLEKYSFNYDFPNDNYFSTEHQTMVLNTIYSRDDSCFSIGDYDQRKYFQIVSNTNGDSVITAEDQLQVLNTLSYDNGEYILRVTARDASGNEDSASMIIQICNTLAVPVLLLPPIGAFCTTDTIRLVWNGSEDAEWYRVQVSLDSDFSVLVFEDSALVDTAVEIQGIAELTKYFWRVRAGNEHLQSDWSAVWNFYKGNYLTMHIPVRFRWNLVSLPLIVVDGLKNHVFPEAISDAYAFGSDSGYVRRDTLAPKGGYWLKFPEADQVPLEGYLADPDTLELVEGWNLIGSIAVPVGVANIRSIPGGVTVSQFFGFDNWYSPSDTIHPGKGYFVRVAEPCSLVLSSSPGMLLSSAAIRITAGPETPPPPPVGEGDNDALPNAWGLGQNYPNPFNPATTVKFRLARAGDVSLKVYDVLGREIASLISGVKQPGEHSVTWDASNQPGGVYLCRFMSGSLIETIKLILMK